MRNRAKASKPAPSYSIGDECLSQVDLDWHCAAQRVTDRRGTDDLCMQRPDILLGCVTVDINLD